MNAQRFEQLIVVLILLLSPLFSAAEPLPGNSPTTPLPGSNRTTPSATTQYSVQNPLKAKSIPQFIEQVLEAAIIIGLPVAVLAIVYAGFRFVVARGNPGKIELARNNLLYTIVGIGIFLGAWIIAKIIFNTVTSLGG